jgi:glycosyltransferase involved in cell wall biosynthesis
MPDMPASLSIVIPCFNEAGNIRNVARDLQECLAQLDRRAEVIFVDDGSRDETWECIEEIAAEDSRVCGVRQMRNYGQSLAYQAGIERASGDYVILYPADREASPSYFIEVVAKLDEGWDFVNTHRVGRWDGHRALSSKFGNALINIISGLKLEDRGSGLKGIRANLAHSLRFYGEMHRFIPDYASLHTDRILELKTDFLNREYGQSAYKGSVRSLSVFLDLITLAFLIHCARRPFPLAPGRVFGFNGLVISAFGVLTTIWLMAGRILFGSPLADRPLFLIGILATILGIMMVMLGVTGEMAMRAYYETGARSTHLDRQRIGRGLRAASEATEEDVFG